VALVTLDAPKASYQKAGTGPGDSQFDMLKHLELSHEDFGELSQHCAMRGIEFMSTPFDAHAAEFLAGIGMSRIKVSSGDLTNIPFLHDLAKLRLPMIISTGMATLGECEEAVDCVLGAGLTMNQLSILHCTTEYPAPIGEVNLRAMYTLSQAFPGATIGYSDHTQGIAIPIAAVGLGAKIIEKHLTLDRNLPGPDHAASLEPGELKSMVSSIHQVCEALGDGRKRPMPSELPNRLAARKSIVAIREIMAGEVFSIDNLALRRPGNGLQPRYWNDIIGTTSRRNFKVGEMISLNEKH
jgi:N,N'-diacetyllegionaminate synthase